MRKSSMCQSEVLEVHEGKEAEMLYKEIMTKNFKTEWMSSQIATQFLSRIIKNKSTPKQTKYGAKTLHNC